ncbi:MAG: SDR family oxidoreductase [Acidobacteriota bacterium]|jgi:3-oxoacyl-[acyl-carrier protein] reductase
MSVALVTGGSRGLGRAVVEMLVDRGWKVAFTFRSGEEPAREIEAATGGNARAFALDLADRERPASLVTEVESALGPIEGLVNNAGVRQDGLLALTADGDWDAAMEVNLGGVFRCCRAVLRTMVPRRSGSVVNLSSLTALHGVAGQTAYGAAKAGVLGLTRSLAREVGRRGIRVNAVVPGFVATDMVADLPEFVVERLRASEVMPGGTSPEAVASAVCFLLSAEAAAITGQALVVDAGASA